MTDLFFAVYSRIKLSAVNISALFVLTRARTVTTFCPIILLCSNLQLFALITLSAGSMVLVTFEVFEL